MYHSPFHEETDVYMERHIDEHFDFETQDINAAMLGMLPQLVDKARQAAIDLPESYRIKVGCAALAYNPYPPKPQVGLYVAGNYKKKLGKEDFEPDYDVEIPKICTEMASIMVADADEMMRFGIFVVAASTRPDDIQGINGGYDAATLVPCVQDKDDEKKDNCYSVMKANRTVDSKTIILSIGKTRDIAQVQTFSEYYKRYSVPPEDFEDAPVYSYRTTGLSSALVHEYDKLVAERHLKGRETSKNKKNQWLRREMAYRAIKNTLVEIYA